jgi:hypothetical protein
LVLASGPDEIEQRTTQESPHNKRDEHDSEKQLVRRNPTIETEAFIAWQLFSLTVRELGGCSAGATSIELAGLGTLRDAEATGATTTGVGDAHRAGGAICVMAARLNAGAVAVTTTMALMPLADALEAVAVAELIVAAARESGGA